MKKYIFLIIVLGIVPLLFSQDLDTLWTSHWGGNNYEILNKTIETYNSNYISIGYTNSYGAGVMDMLLISYNSNGDTLWTKTYGGVSNENAMYITYFSNGYLIAGYTASYGNGGNDIYLLRIDTLGDTLWTKTYGGASDENAYCIMLLDSGFFILGYTASYGSGGNDIYLLRTDTLGDTLWTKTYGGADDEEGHIIFPNNNGFLIIGNTYSFGNYQDIYLIQIDSTGDTLWTKTIGGTYYDYMKNCIKSGNNYLIFGGTNSFGSGLYDYYLIAIDTLGDTLWTKTYGGIDNDMGTGICGNNNIFYLGGYSKSFSTGDYDCYFIKIDSLGNKLSDLIVSAGSNDEIANDIMLTNDNNIIFAGYTNSIGAGYNDAYWGMIFDNTSFIENNYNNDVKIIKTEFSDKLKFFIENPYNEIVNINIYNSLGQKIANPINNRVINGEFSYSINPGLYFYEIRIGSNIYKGKTIVF